jgi:hypothetical protein
MPLHQQLDEGVSKREFVPAAAREPELVTLTPQQPAVLQSRKRLKQLVASTSSKRGPIRIPLDQRQQPNLGHASG